MLKNEINDLKCQINEVQSNFLSGNFHKSLVEFAVDNNTDEDNKELFLSEVHVNSENGNTSLATTFRRSKFVAALPFNLSQLGIMEIQIRHRMGTTLNLVGMQVWNGALLLSDFVLWQSDGIFSSDEKPVVLELGAGTGLVSIVCGLVGCLTVYATDIGYAENFQNDKDDVDCSDNSEDIIDLETDVETRKRKNDDDISMQKKKVQISRRENPEASETIENEILTETPILDLLQQNIVENKVENSVCVRYLDLSSEISFAPSLRDSKYSWKHDDILTRNPNQPCIIIAADIIYDFKLTLNFVLRMPELLVNGRNLFLSLERRENFTIGEGKVSAPTYDYLFDLINAFNDNLENDDERIKREQIQIETIPQYFKYQRSISLEFWRFWKEFTD
ncbi:Methyltransferase-like protein 22 [Nowakowskiella sp. JEL0078]|nr:Methyltransferase-like protein 22 [Nowakowskiella sp. JEL0078]